MTVESLVATLSKYPELKKRVEEIVKVVENNGESIKLADAAEDRLIEEGRHMNKAALEAWAENQASKSSKSFERRHKNTHKAGKKNSAGTAPLEILKSPSKPTV